MLLGSSWQRRRVHFTRNVLDTVSKTNAEMVAAAIRTIFAQPDADHVVEQFEVIATMLTRSHPKVGHMLTGAREDLLAFTGFPAAHWKRIWSTNPPDINRLSWAGQGLGGSRCVGGAGRGGARWRSRRGRGGLLRRPILGLRRRSAGRGCRRPGRSTLR